MAATQFASLRLIALMTALCLGIALSGCSTTKPEVASSPSTSTSPSANEYDISAISHLKGDFPPLFVPWSSGLLKVQAEWLAGMGAVVSSAGQLSVDPPECRLLLKPVEGHAGADTFGIRADGPDGQGISVNADDPVTVPVEIPSTGCDRMTYSVADASAPISGTVERIATPTLQGATTFALKILVNNFPYVDYYYGAILDNRVFVNVHARVDPSFQGQPLLPGMLTKAVAAIRGR